MTRLLRVQCLIAAVSAVQVGIALGQESSGGSGRHRVRVTAPSITADPVVGDLVAIDDDAITVMRSGADKIVVPVESVTRLEVRRRGGRRLLGAAIGFGAGAMIGGLIGRATEDDRIPPSAGECGFLGCDPFGDLPSNADLGAGIGGLLGAAVGALVAPGEKWETVDHENAQISVGPLIGRHRVGVLLAVRF